ncbi:DEAD/DEAH box helicase [Nocardiopsis sp. JB363]|uniref:DEAD/DEAH box helicase n=1 Tax=Nocardiopsis sp. JB363 TaxID=1434837 RepID=UPI00097B9DA9|nr:DEAD/DEAH box helicase [Nocardiopsis sp. JB363]SIO87198.1 putative helicase [Nocardiopsis sp. JB363]
MRESYQLQEHQRDALRPTLETLATNDRTFTVMPCGTGKTILGRAVQDHLAPRGCVLTLVPRISLVGQTLADYRNLGDERFGTILAVCSDPSIGQDRHLHGLTVVATTDPAVVATTVAHAVGRVTVVATYQALDTLISAHRDHDLPTWAVVVLDEAHRLVGSPDWSRALDNTLVPARYRVGVTATPRVVATSSAGQESPELVAMDDPERFGPRAHTLSFAEAREQNLLAPYRVATPVITPGHVRSLVDRSEHLLVGDQPGALSAQVLAVQLAVLQAMHRFGNRRALTFHPRLPHARLWARTLPQVATLLQEPPVRVQARHLNGAHSHHRRSQVLEEFTSAMGEDEIRAITSVGLYRDGLDAPSCDTAVITHPLTSVEAGVQMLSRPLRVDPERPDKVALFVLPIVLSATTDPDHLGEILTDSGWGTLWSALRALGAMDEDIFIQHARPSPASTALSESGSQTAFPPWWSLTGVPIPSGFAHAIMVRAAHEITPQSPDAVESVYRAALMRFLARERHLNIPSKHVEDGFALGQRAAHKRSLHRRGALPADEVAWHEELGFPWDMTGRDEKWDRAFSHTQAFFTEHGHLNIPRSHRPEGFHLTEWLRRQHADWDSLPDTRRTRLERIGMGHELFQTRSEMWEDAFTHAEKYFAEHGHLNVPQQHHVDGFGLGSWIKRQRSRWDKLSTEQRTRLLRLGFKPKTERPKKSTLDRPKAPSKVQQWENAFAQAERFFHEHGHLDVPCEHTVNDVHLGRWVHGQLHCWDRLSPARQQQLLDIGFDPAHKAPARSQQWENAFTLATAFFTQHGHLNVPKSHTPQGFRLRKWLRRQHNSWDELTQDHQARLNTIGMDPELFARRRPCSEPEQGPR